MSPSPGPLSKREGTKQRPSANKPRRGSSRRLGPEPLSVRATATVNRLLEAGARVFANDGFHGANAEQIAVEANLSRGAFYKYFDDKLDLLRELSKRCESEVVLLLESLPRMVADPRFGADLREWLPSFISLVNEYASVFRVWMESNVSDQIIEETGERVSLQTSLAIREMVEGVDRSYSFDLRAAGLMFVALLQRVPQAAALAQYVHSDEDLVEILASFIERGLLNSGSALPKNNPTRRRSSKL
jgi:AcrR family transcriptional regulator